MLDNNAYGVSRRLLLKAVGSVGATAIGQAGARPFDRADAPSEGTAALDGQSYTAAVEWVTRALWQETGVSTEFPGQVVFPRYTHLAVTAAQTADPRTDSVGEEPARAATRLQDGETGGFFRQHGDFLGPWTTDTYHALSLARQFDVPVDETAAAEFLLDQQTDAGGFSPRIGFTGGSIASTLEATHKSTAALAALDALSQPVREQVVAFVHDTQHATGGWPVTPNQNAPTVKGTYHAIAALSVLDALTADTVRAATGFLRAVQQPTGGFRGHLAPADCSSSICRLEPEVATRTTAQALITLSRIDRLDQFSHGTHTEWLAGRQRRNPADERFYGGFETAPDRTPPVTNYLLNTAFAVSALEASNALDRIDRSAASRFIAACRHPGSNGFGPWPSSLSSLVDTEAAIHALDALGEPGRVPEDALAETLANQQRADGSITQLDWTNEATVEQTALAVLALDRLDRLGAIDHTAAAFITERQHESGGFTNKDESGSAGVSLSPRITWLAVRALAATNELSAIDRDGVGTYLADRQGDRGHVSEESPDSVSAVRETRYALETLARLDRLAAIDVESAVAYLAGRQQEGGYTSETEARHVVLGLAAADAIGEIDQQLTRRLLREQQTTEGGFAERGFYTGETAMQRHAGTIEALSMLDNST